MSDDAHNSAERLAPNANTLWAKALVDELARSGLRSVCISPGSRSTPLVVQFAAHPDIDDISIVDERSGGFVALGIAQATRRPVALVCTSGTAAANFFPAVCEASSAGIPLLVLTADRPPELQDCGASQAMDQLKLYGDHVRWFHQVSQPEATPKKLRYVRSLACRAYNRALSPQAGPVHLNFPFRKPLEPIEVPADHPDSVPTSLADEDPVAAFGRDGGRPFVAVHTARPAPDLAAIDALDDALARAERPLILAGADPNAADYREALVDFAERTGAPIAAEPTSGLRHWAGRNSNVISTADFLFDSGFYETVGKPDLVIRTGRSPLLWSAQSLVRGLEDAEQIVVGRAENLADPDHVVSLHLMCDERALFEEAGGHKATCAWLTAHRGAEEVALDTLRRTLDAEPALSAARMWRELGTMLPEGSALFVSNSMPIRNLDTFMCGARSSVDVFFNRGLNGIDGINSTGLGIALARKQLARKEQANEAPTVIVTGDVALRHDVSGLYLAAELAAQQDVGATIIVVDNDGGGIFDYLPIAKFGSVHERHFTTPPERALDGTALGCLEVSEPKDWSEFRAAVERSMTSAGTQLVRVRTDRAGDKELRETTRREVAAKIDESIRGIVQ
ncbi:2-succinyl-5-enolpyruvyl-6-hydroxy-3-cyclohexene-1-carboxylic-acid synthase [Persicimonas caeni]|uniref:2-succinyl-5-enolpyruvyl-6-hydroxy-3-cyclohexene-1-carboxylate synthase n=1 Tax=Persicimonas caeni TaxID=2292766 RepID=A0A4Y6Q1E2_PERCE|nr:2-succinyl-5-enolpyruvyl-6-hydroxy-3-cyclohexene-1-carboxylic-acid synthase [Persicimonas caeni]QDG54401.1 2-succinyl-5-enolpyruvyl-6-hydroxy-3-cyclohexene-1-carboxylic-acid synthase [Persicimonas caeni]QED35622.1 2-succinyl-5-enolpyruvyl-6-hydroxy-3-cyclohexene-1-carboxylic-acid synthase [Persicimonas caeni]